MFELEQFLYDTLFDYLTENSAFKDYLLIVKPQSDNLVIPDEKVVVQVQQINRYNLKKTLNYKEYHDRFSFSINVYTRGIDGYDKRNVAQTVLGEIHDLMVHTHHLKLDNIGEVPNLDLSVYRYLVTFSCLFDTENKIIYPNY